MNKNDVPWWERDDYHPCGDCAYYGECKILPEECEYSEACELQERTVFLLADGVQFTVEGNVKPVDTVGCTYEEEVTEVVDNYLVYCYTLVPEK
jgi:hypothetical protein